MVTLEIPDELFRKFVSDLDHFSDRPTIEVGDNVLIAKTDSKYEFKMIDETVTKIIDSLKNIDHDLLIKQIKLIDDIFDYTDSIIELEWTFDRSGLKIEDLNSIANLLGTIHDLYHAHNKDDC